MQWIISEIAVVLAPKRTYLTRGTLTNFFVLRVAEFCLKNSSDYYCSDAAREDARKQIFVYTLKKCFMSWNLCNVIS